MYASRPWHCWGHTGARDCALTLILWLRWCRCWLQYALATNSPKEKATGLFAGIFAFTYLGCEVLLKLVAKPAFSVPEGQAVTLESPGVVELFSAYSLVSIVSCIGASSGSLVAFAVTGNVGGVHC